jgi:hypothetical protein
MMEINKGQFVQLWMKECRSTPGTREELTIKGCVRSTGVGETTTSGCSSLRLYGEGREGWMIN